MRVATMAAAISLAAHATPGAAQEPAALAPLAQARQITHVLNDSPFPAPDGRHMVYIVGVAGREQLFTRLIDGGDVRQITTDSADHEDPAWSPDGRWIAFVYKTGHAERIARIPATGGAMELLSPATERAIHPTWSPDGSRVAYCTDDDVAPPRKNASDIRVIDLATRAIRTLVTGGVNTYPVWSPDGRRLAFRRMLGDTNSEIFVGDAEGRDARNVTNDPAFDGWPAWSPDGRWIAFASNRVGMQLRGDYQIFVMRPDGSDVRRVAATTGRATAPQWARDGHAIYFPICRRADTGFDCEIFGADVSLDGNPAPPSR